MTTLSSLRVLYLAGRWGQIKSPQSETNQVSASTKHVYLSLIMFVLQEILIIRILVMALIFQSVSCMSLNAALEENVPRQQKSQSFVQTANQCRTSIKTVMVLIHIMFPLLIPCNFWFNISTLAAQGFLSSLSRNELSVLVAKNIFVSCQTSALYLGVHKSSNVKPQDLLCCRDFRGKSYEDYCGCISFTMPYNRMLIHLVYLGHITSG